MEQTRTMSMVEVVTGSLIAFLVSMWANYLVLPLFGFNVKLSESLAITFLFTIISLVRSYLVRRLFVRFGAKLALLFDGFYSWALGTAYLYYSDPEFPVEIPSYDTTKELKV